MVQLLRLRGEHPPVDRLPPGEDITNMHPWKIFQMTSDPYGGAGKPVEFFMPGSNAQELMAVYEKYAVLADEYSGVPRYMTGDAPAHSAAFPKATIDATFSVPARRLFSWLPPMSDGLNADRLFT